MRERERKREGEKKKEEEEEEKEKRGERRGRRRRGRRRRTKGKKNERNKGKKQCRQSHVLKECTSTVGHVRQHDYIAGGGDLKYPSSSDCTLWRYFTMTEISLYL